MSSLIKTSLSPNASAILKMTAESSVLRTQKGGIASYIHGGQYLHAEVVKKNGKNLLSDPIYNKGLAFPPAERDRLGIRGLIPTSQLAMEEQEKVIMDEYELGWADRAEREPDDEIIKSGVSPDNIRKWKVLQSVQDRNETLFYRILMDNFIEMAPIIYTPTVGWACSHFSHLFRRSRGMFISPQDRGEMASMVYNWPSSEVDAVVVTDGSRVLGMGDLGIGGLGISIGKLDLYVAAGGFHPRRVLPVVLDIGTANPKLLSDPRYLGIKQPRLEGDEYYSFVDEFMAAVKLRWPRALIQFEDFQSKHAANLLNRYRHEYLMFNDDIQGTAATVLAGLYGAMKVQGLGPESLKDQRILVCGAGSAGSGVILTIRNALIARSGLSIAEASSKFHIVDEKGLISKARSNLAEMEELFEDLSSFAEADTGMEGFSLLDTVKRVKPTILIGLSGCGGLFTPDVLKAMGENVDAPVILPLSNPTSRSECSAEDAQEFTDGRAIFASGSPFPDVTRNGSLIASSQCNNRYIFPGLALGAALGQTGIVSDSMIQIAAEALVELLTNDDVASRSTFPQNADIREISCHLAALVFIQATKEGVKHVNKEMLESFTHGGYEELKQYIYSKMWNPSYRPLVHRS